eukprot:68010-Pyramimonas_sp.AAC.1
MHAFLREARVVTACVPHSGCPGIDVSQLHDIEFVVDATMRKIITTFTRRFDRRPSQPFAVDP